MHWTQAQLAEQLHVSTNAVSKWELGKNAINMEYLKDISKLLNIPMSMLADVPPEAPESDGLPSDSSADCPQPNTETDNSSPEEEDNFPMEVNEQKPGRKNFFFLFSAIGIVLAAAVIIVCLVCLNNKPSFEIQNEYFDTYEGQKACFLIADYKGKLTSDILNEYSPIIRESYSNYFTDAEVIIILYYRDSLHEKIINEDTADAIQYLYPH